MAIPKHRAKADNDQRVAVKRSGGSLRRGSLHLPVRDVIEPLGVVVVFVSLEINAVGFLEEHICQFPQHLELFWGLLTGSSMYNIPSGTSKSATSSRFRPMK